MPMPSEKATRPNANARCSPKRRAKCARGSGGSPLDSYTIARSAKTRLVQRDLFAHPRRRRAALDLARVERAAQREQRVDVVFDGGVEGLQNIEWQVGQIDAARQADLDRMRHHLVRVAERQAL